MFACHKPAAESPLIQLANRMLNFIGHFCIHHADTRFATHPVTYIVNLRPILRQVHPRGCQRLPQWGACAKSSAQETRHQPYIWNPYHAWHIRMVAGVCRNQVRLCELPHFGGPSLIMHQTYSTKIVANRLHWGWPSIRHSAHINPIESFTNIFILYQFYKNNKERNRCVYIIAIIQYTFSPK